ncbi:MAG: response regulator transcription factor [Chlorobi bacterium]|nr:response regulator transcription factor [Chlorobiota bacterium]
MKIKCIVVDDEFLARTLLADYIERIPQLELTAKCSGATEAMEVLRTEDVDLMFLDIQMPEQTGVDMLHKTENKPVVIFTTAYSEYALQGYSLGVIDYLLKPISFERFSVAVEKATEQISLMRKAGVNNRENYIVIRAEHKLIKVYYDDIIYIEGLKEYVAFHLKDNKKIIALMSLKGLENNLPEKFIRIHRSFIVNKEEVKSIHRNKVEIAGKKIDIGKTYKGKVKKDLFS